jgi:hypothetical protein
MDGASVGALPFEAQGVPLGWAVDDSGRVVAGMLGVRSGPRGGTIDSVVTVHAVDSAGARIVARLPFRPGVTPSAPVFYGPPPVFARLGDGDLIVGLGDRYELRVHDRNGALVRILSRPRSADPISSADQDALLNAAFRTVDSTRRAPMIAQMKQHGGIAGEYPAYARIVAGDEEIFVERVARPGDSGFGRLSLFDMDNTGSGQWDVFATDGTFRRSFSLPAGVRLRRVLDDRIIADGLDSLDVPVVKLYRIRR